jgi:8-oxo-dGTP diphosphatase
MTQRPAAPLTEQQFLAQYDASRFPHPSVAVDVAVLTVADHGLQVLAVQRTEHPALGHWSLPGGFVQLDESLDAAAHRVLAAKAGLQRIFLEQLYTFGEPLRDPRTRVISVAYYALVPASQLPAAAAEPHGVQLARLHVPWSGERGGPVNLLDGQSQPLPVAFDHADILGLAVKRLRGKLNYAPLGFELLPRKFTLRQLQTIHETILDQRLNKDSFRRRMLATGLLAPTGQYESDVGHRPAELYRFKRKPTP